MLKFLKTLIRRDAAAPKQRPTLPRPKASAGTASARRGASTGSRGHIETIGPGKNVLVGSRLEREDTGTHETLRIIDDSLVDDGDDGGIDPYNTGDFDRSKHWDKRFRK